MLPSRQLRQSPARHAELALCFQVTPDLLAIALTRKKLLVGAQHDHGLIGIFVEQLDAETAQAMLAEFIEEKSPFSRRASRGCHPLIPDPNGTESRPIWPQVRSCLSP